MGVFSLGDIACGERVLLLTQTWYSYLSIISRGAVGGGVSKLEIEGVPPIAVEHLLEYCYKDRYNFSSSSIIQYAIISDLTSQILKMDTPGTSSGDCGILQRFSK